MITMEDLGAMATLGSVDIIAFAFRKVLPLAINVEMTKDITPAGDDIFITITCPHPTDEEKIALNAAVKAVMPASVSWALITLDGPFDTPERRGQAETAWRLGDLPALNTLVEQWAKDATE